MPSRTLHNLINAAFLGFSGNELHAFMDRFAKTARHKHRDVGGHDTMALIQMLMLFKHKYTPKQIRDTFILHKIMDGMFSGIQTAVRDKNKGYGKKKSIEETFEKLKEEYMRL